MKQREGTLGEVYGNAERDIERQLGILKTWIKGTMEDKEGYTPIVKKIRNSREHGVLSDTNSVMGNAKLVKLLSLLEAVHEALENERRRSRRIYVWGGGLSIIGPSAIASLIGFLMPSLMSLGKLSLTVTPILLTVVGWKALSASKQMSEREEKIRSHIIEQIASSLG